VDQAKAIITALQQLDSASSAAAIKRDQTKK